MTRNPPAAFPGPPPLHPRLSQVCAVAFAMPLPSSHIPHTWTRLSSRFFSDSAGVQPSACPPKRRTRRAFFLRQKRRLATLVLVLATCGGFNDVLALGAPLKLVHICEHFRNSISDIKYDLRSSVAVSLLSQFVCFENSDSAVSRPTVYRPPHILNEQLTGHGPIADVTDSATSGPY